MIGRNTQMTFRAGRLLLAAVATIAVSVPPAGADQLSGIAVNASAGTVSAISIDPLRRITAHGLQASSSPHAAVIAPGGVHAYVAVPDENAVRVLDVASLNPVAVVAAGSGPYAVAASPAGNLVYVANRLDATVTAISTASFEAVATIAVGAGPSAIAFSSDGARAYVVNATDATLSVIAASTNTVVDTLSAGVADPVDVAVSRDDLVLLVASSGGTVKAISLQFAATLRSIAVGGAARSVTIAPNGATAYVPIEGGGVAAIDVASLSGAGTMAGLGGTASVAFADNGLKGYASDSSGGRVVAFDPAVLTAAETVDLGAGISAVALAPPILPQTGWWWNPDESGRGFSVEIRAGRVFLSSYLYAEDGSAAWYISQGAMGTNAFGGDLVQYVNGQTLAGPYRAPTLLGTVSQAIFAFTSPALGSLTWAGGTTALRRFDIVAGGVAAGPAAGMPQKGWWWNANEGGRGYFIEIQNDTLFFSAFMYDESGRPAWYVSQAPMVSTTLYQGQLTRCVGGQTITSPYRMPACAADAGTLTMQFSSRSAGTMTLPNGTQVAIVRFTEF